MTTLQTMAWASSFLGVGGHWFISKRKWYGWLMGFVAAIAYLCANIHFKLWGFMPATFMSMGICLLSAYRWFKEEQWLKLMKK